MAIRFRRSLKVAPGLTLNLGKKSASIRVGRRGAGLTMGTAGKRATVGVPGTGLSYTTKVGSKSRNETPTDDKAQPSKLGMLGWLGIMAVVVGVIWVVNAFTG